MSTARLKVGATASGVLLALLLLVGLVFGGLAEAQSTPEPSPAVTASPTPSPTETPVEEVCNPERTVKEFFLDQAFKPGEVRVGSEVSFRGAPQERGPGSFGYRTLRSQKDVAQFLHRNKPARRHVYRALVPRFGKAEYNRALSGEGYVPVQFTVPVKVFGTTYLMNRATVVTAKGGRYARANDIFWVFVTEKCQIVKAASIRADCSNPNFKAIVPVRGKPPRNIPPIGQPPKKCPSSGICGTPGSGPDYHPPQENPGYPPGATEPTDGYTPGPDGNTPPVTSDPAPDPGGSDGGTCTGNQCYPGGDDGTSDPDDSPPHDEEPPNDGDPCAGPDDSDPPHCP